MTSKRRAKRGVPHLAVGGRREFFSDGIQNYIQRVGNLQPQTSAVSRYSYGFKSFDRTDLEALYQTSWLGGLAVDVVAEDMTREGVALESPERPDAIDAIESAMDRYRI